MKEQCWIEDKVVDDEEDDGNVAEDLDEAESGHGITSEDVLPTPPEGSNADGAIKIVNPYGRATKNWDN